MNECVAALMNVVSRIAQLIRKLKKHFLKIFKVESDTMKLTDLKCKRTQFIQSLTQQSKYYLNMFITIYHINNICQMKHH